jgi:hypothetical protein
MMIVCRDKDRRLRSPGRDDAFEFSDEAFILKEKSNLRIDLKGEYVHIIRPEQTLLPIDEEEFGMIHLWEHEEIHSEPLQYMGIMIIHSIDEKAMIRLAGKKNLDPDASMHSGFEK